MGQRIREARERLGMTQEELAERIGRNRETISHYEIGNRAVAINELPLLAEALQVSLGYFYGQNDPDGEALDLMSELQVMPADQKKMVLDRWRFELEWWKKHSSLPQGSPQD